eukprot:comp24232_c2_seq2/m.44682 comp24232_c2_seq2/g.44682  ORF comp24232_c2_seq2/g.44682 comp24232_c2_seq2/m.44682 type:complete len:376 (-) comp24232_c2_seq2:96-1223(-)
MGDSTLSTELFQLTNALVEIPSNSVDMQQNERILAFVEEFFQGTSWYLRRSRKGPDSSPALYISPSATATHSKLLYLLHLDVVPADTYKVTGSEEGTVYGRGVSDMKGPAAALLHLAKSLDPLSHDLALLVVTDEEIGGLDGAKFCFMDEEGPHITCDVCHCPDGGDNFKVVTHEKGVLRCQITATGKRAHSAYVWLGENAIHELYTQLEKFMQMVDDDGQAVFNNGADMWHTTACVTYVGGGQAINQVPGEAWAKIDMRFTEKWTLETLKAKVVKSMPDCKVEFFFEQPMMLCDPNLPWVEDTVAAIGQYTHQSKVEFVRGHGTSDGHWASFPVVMFKPVGGGLHQDGEWLDFPSLLTYYLIIRDLTAKWAAKR